MGFAKRGPMPFLLSVLPFKRGQYRFQGSLSSQNPFGMQEHKPEYR